MDTIPTPTGTQAIDRAAQLLVRVVESAEPQTVGELAERSGLPKSTTSRLVAALERQGLVQRIEDRGRLRPGPVLLRYANRDTAATLVELAAPSLRRLADVSGETINLAVPGPDAARRSQDVPLYTLRSTSGATIQLSDPGAALITGKFADAGKFVVPELRGLAVRAPYFHDGSAASLGAVVKFYNDTFDIHLSGQEQADLIAFLGAL